MTAREACCPGAGSPAGSSGARVRPRALFRTPSASRAACSSPQVRLTLPTVISCAKLGCPSVHDRGSAMTEATDAADKQRPVRSPPLPRAQEDDYEQALAEIKSGRKRSHWMWYIFPQFDGLAFSSTSKFYAIKSVEEARAYLDHPILGPRLQACAEAALQVEGRSATRDLRLARRPEAEVLGHAVLPSVTPRLGLPPAAREVLPGPAR